MSRETRIEFRDVALGYDATPVLRDLTFRVCDGDFVGIVGPNGAGKTTVLRGILGLLSPVAGVIDTGGVAPRFGYVPQRQTVDEGFPLSAFDVVMMGRYALLRRRRPGPGDREACDAALRSAGLQRHRDTPFRFLSGGQKQRALIARALASEPDLFVLDEPTSGMDLRGEHDVMSLVARLHDERELTVIMVSHQLNTVARWVHELGILNEGRLDLGPIDDILTTDRLQRVYGAGVRVATLDGQRVVLPPRGVS